jgi:hypothetical protein
MEQKIIEAFKYLCIWISLGVSVFLISMGINLDTTKEYMRLTIYVAVVCYMAYWLGKHDNKEEE